MKNLITIISTILSFVALFVQIAGAYIMYKNSPDNKSNVAQSTSFGNADYDTPKRRNRRIKTGFGILAIGFIIQMISMIVQLFAC